MKKWIFLKSTRKGLLKNVQDGISRLLESQEISKQRGVPFFDSPCRFTHNPPPQQELEDVAFTNTGCPTILFPLLFFEFLGFLGV